MLAVVLIPIAIMIAACLLERFEARALAVDPPQRVSRADLRTPTAPPVPHLSLVPETGARPAAVGLDAPTANLRRAS